MIVIELNCYRVKEKVKKKYLAWKSVDKSCEFLVKISFR